MVNPLYLFSALCMVAGVQACKRTCSATGDSAGTCSYNCTHVCSSISANEARNTFLAALQSSGNSCSAVGTSVIHCTKTASFGSCYDHYWLCGRGC
ncbi:hypothetical protein HYE68_000045 [Fusarium pseudograminearum]|nr:hypothetical protein HYE68_000045 [Fusarium pseudograminearum]